MTRALAVAAAALALAACSSSNATDGEQVDGPPASIVRGVDEPGLPQVVLVHAGLWGGGVLRCTGTYVAPRLVLTAAHCLRPDIRATRFFVYSGTDYLADRAVLPAIPAPGQPSPWAHVDGWVQHPDYDPQLHYPDVALLYLDRPLPFAPLPLYPERVGERWTGKLAQLVGWGGSKALVADITQVEGSGVKRSGWAPIAGSPTEADYHPDDPNAGVLDPAIRQHLLKVDGGAPHANGCAGDSGGPLLLSKGGVKWVAGVASWTGLWCEDYSLYVRLDRLLPWIADSYRYAGFQPLAPALDCVDARGDGTFRAYFSYQNQNRLSVTVPHGPLNRLPQDTGGLRPATFQPGDHGPTFALDFAAGGHLDWQLLPPGGPLTRMRVDERSPRCQAGSRLACTHGCEAMAAATCDPPTSSANWSLESCVSDCLDYDAWIPECAPQNDAWYECIGTLDPKDPARWVCNESDGTTYVGPKGCADEELAYYACLGG